MSLWNKYPYSSMHELNLDWILQLMQELHADWDEFTALNKITIAGAWDITKQYQAWSIVSDNNIGYISLKTVPAGIAINNTDYWGVIGDYAILITDLSNRVSTLENDNIVINADIEALEGRLDLLDDHKYIFVGDSFAGLANSWVDYVVNYKSIPSSDYTLVFEGGAGFCNPGNDTGYTLEQKLNAEISSWTDAKKESITDVIVCGGCNDTQSTYDNSFGTAVQSFCNYVKTNLPNATITAGYNGSYQSNTYRERSLYRSARNRILERFVTASGVGRFVSNIMYLLGDRNIYMDDGIHPDSTGSMMIGLAFVEALKGNCNFTYSYVHKVHNIEYTTGSRYVKIFIKFLDQIYIGDPITVQATGFVTLYSADTTLPIWPTYDHDLYLPVQVRYNSLTAGAAVLRFRPDGTIMLYNAEEQAYNNVTSIAVLGCEYLVEMI